MTRTGIAVSSPDGFPTLSVGRWVKVMVILCAVAVVGLLVCLQFGTERIPLSQIARIELSRDQLIALDHFAFGNEER